MQLHRTHDPLEEVDIDVPVRVLVVADDPLVRSGFIHELAGVAAGGTDAGEHVADIVERTAANVVLWDLGPSTGEECSIDFDVLDVPVLALSPNAAEAAELLARGAAGVLRRDVEAPALRSALETVHHGLTVIERGMLDSGASSEPTQKTDRPVAQLTTREQEVLELLAAGLSNKRIAARLGISSHTAKFHIAAIMSKLDAQSRTEAVVRAVQHGLVML